MGGGSYELLSADNGEALVDSVQAFLFDCDGVIWKGDKLIPGVAQTLDFLRSKGKKLVFVTNNSSKSRKQYAHKFETLGISVSQDEIFSSSYAAAMYLKLNDFPQDKEVYVIGGQGIVDELQLAGYTAHGGPEDGEKKAEWKTSCFFEHDKNVGAVVVGIDPFINYYKLMYGTLCIRENPGCLFVATNRDAVGHMTDLQEWPGAGCMVGAICGSTEREPIVVGKPSTLMMDLLQKKFGISASKMCMVGDRLDTDILFGQSAGCKTLFVLSGVTPESVLHDPSNKIHPDFYTSQRGQESGRSLLTVVDKSKEPTRSLDLDMGSGQSTYESDYSIDSNSNGYPSISSSSFYSPYSEHDVDHGRKRPQSRYSTIDDQFNSIEEVTEALAIAGLESSNLIVGIDFTKSNEWKGARSFNHKSLHHIGDSQNPYEQAISIIGKTLSTFDEDNIIPCFGFGDAKTHDKDVFSFFADNRPCNGFEEVLARYRELVPHVDLSGPTSFAPIIETAIKIVDDSNGQYHVLMIIADGQVQSGEDTYGGKLSPQEKHTIDAIVRASEYPLSIVLVGVGDGPWDMMKKYDDSIPARAFDNFQFVNFTEIMQKQVSESKKESEFALAALMEIPSQYKATIDLHLLGCKRGAPDRFPLPPPVRNSNPRNLESSNHENRTGFRYALSQPSSEVLSRTRHCCLCLCNEKNLAFGCGHQTCRECGSDLPFCPICKTYITKRIRLY
ncbi:hypothetical protein ACFE04_030601 [Oxalis oulophora]